MDMFKNVDPRVMKILKITAIVSAVILVLAFVSGVPDGRRSASFAPFGRIGGMMNVAPSMPGGNVAYDFSTSQIESSAKGFAGGISLSTRNAMMIPPIGGGYTPGTDAEAFEVTDYNATIETRNKEKTCGAISALKSKTYVIFENSNEYDRGCSHTFKVAHENVSEILSVIKDLDPRELSENIQTIKNQVNDFTSQEEILTKKLASIDQTLKSAMSAYDEVTALATQSQDAESLAKIIDSKIQLIERLTQERININTQLDYLSRAKGEQLDRLEYTYFHVNVYENKFVDAKSLEDSWKAALRSFIENINRILQELTVGIVALLLVAVQYLIYAFILVVVVKFAWRGIRKIWLK
jgi:hypothetical protein